MTQHVAGETRSARPKTLLMKGWRGTSHSIALVNQQQVLELLKLNGRQLYHHDLPVASGRSTRSAAGSGFDAAEYIAVDSAIPKPGHAISAPPADACVSPYRAQDFNLPMREVITAEL
jgi:hypothetical protein